MVKEAQTLATVQLARIQWTPTLPVHPAHLHLCRPRHRWGRQRGLRSLPRRKKANLVSARFMPRRCEQLGGCIGHSVWSVALVRTRGVTSPCRRAFLGLPAPVDIFFVCVCTCARCDDWQQEYINIGTGQKPEYVLKPNLDPDAPNAKDWTCFNERCEQVDHTTTRRCVRAIVLVATMSFFAPVSRCASFVDFVFDGHTLIVLYVCAFSRSTTGTTRSAKSAARCVGPATMSTGRSSELGERQSIVPYPR